MTIESRVYDILASGARYSFTDESEIAAIRRLMQQRRCKQVNAVRPHMLVENVPGWGPVIEYLQLQ